MLKPIGFANGDGGTGRGATMVRRSIFRDFPMIEVPVTVEARIATNDACIAEAVKVFQRCGTGFKNSTASADPLMARLGWPSANIKMRPMTNSYAMLRVLQGPGRYANPCGVIRLATGGFYDEQSCEIIEIEGKETAIVTNHLDLDKLESFAKLAAKIARTRGWHLVLASKSTIAASEKLFRERIESAWRQLGLVEGVAWSKDGNLWTGDWHHELSDIAIARLPIENGDGVSPFAQGKFLLVADNSLGDTASDVIDLQHGNHVMGSTVFCSIEGRDFFYEELAGGTADAMATGPLKGSNFLSPVGIIFGMASAIESVNPGQKDFLDAVRRETLDYLEQTPGPDRDTEEMITRVATRTKSFLLA